MLGIGSVLALVAAVALFRFHLSRGVYRRVPIELLALLTASVVLGFLAMSRGGGLLVKVVFGAEAAALAASLLYLIFMARFPRQELAVEVGDRLPRFELPDSDGEPFDSESLVGETSALYLFYRGDW